MLLPLSSMKVTFLVLACWSCAGHARIPVVALDSGASSLQGDAGTASLTKAIASLLAVRAPVAVFKAVSMRRAFGRIGNRRGYVAMGPALYAGEQLQDLRRGSGRADVRSPVVSWYASEIGLDLEINPFGKSSKHPFEQAPFLTDDGGVEVFESGAILLYLADKYGAADTPEKRAMYTKWVMWANSELERLCFGATPLDIRISGTCIDNPNFPEVAKLEEILSESDYLVNNEFSVADVAVASYLNYVPVLFDDANLVDLPSIAQYMERCAQRPAYAKAFGQGLTSKVLQKVKPWADPAPIFSKDGLMGFADALARQGGLNRMGDAESNKGIARRRPNDRPYR